MTASNPSPADPGPIGLKAEAVGMTYRRGSHETVALSDCSLDVPRGTWASQIGALGCGKSTLLRIFADIVKPTAAYPVSTCETERGLSRTDDFWIIVAIRREDETEIRPGRSAGRTGREGHPASDAPALFG